MRGDVPQKETPAEAGAHEMTSPNGVTSAATMKDCAVDSNDAENLGNQQGYGALKLEVSNEEFLAAIFGDAYQMAHVTAFVDSPDKIDPKDRDAAARCWGGGWYSQKAPTLKANWNTYFTISTFHPLVDETGTKARRRKALFDCTHCVVVDDVGTKVQPDDRLLPPSWSLETSPGNFQWGYKLRGGERDRQRVEGLVNAMVARGLAAEGKDPGMKGVTRYVRLPQGSNRKSSWIEKLGPSGWRCQMHEWHPEREYTVSDLAAAFGITEDEIHQKAEVTHTKSAKQSASQSSDPVLQAFADLGMYKDEGADGYHHVTCPNMGMHSDGDDSGSAIRVNADGTYGYKCHHGHCVEDFRFPQVLEWFEREHPEFGLAEKIGSRASPDEFPDVAAETNEKRDYILCMIENSDIEGSDPDELVSNVERELAGIKGLLAETEVQELIGRLQAVTKRSPEELEQQTGLKDESRLSFFPYNVLQLAPTEFVVDGFLGVGLAVIAGMPGVGKTSLLVPLAAVVAHLFDSPMTPVLRRKVIYFSESPRQVETVLYGLAKKAPGAKPHEFGEWLKVVPSHRMSADRLGKVVRRAVEEHTVTFNGYPVAPLIVLDTSNATVDLENENDNSEVGRAIAAIKENLGTGGCWLVQHIAKSLKRADVTEMTARGAGAFGGDAEATAFVFAEDDLPNKRFMWLDKHRFEAQFREVEFTTETAMETVETPWKTTQEITYRVGFPAPSDVASRKAQVEKRKERQQDERAGHVERQVRAFLHGKDPQSMRKISDGIGGKANFNYEVMRQMVEDGQLVSKGTGRGGGEVYAVGLAPDFDD